MQKTKFSAVMSTFVACFLFWILLTWPFGGTGTALLEELAAGVIVSLAAALFSARFIIHDNAVGFLDPVKLWHLISNFFGIFLVELFKANVDMAKRCFGGCKDVNPGIVKIPVDLRSEYGQAMLANSITLTPGTITMDVTEEEGQTYYYIHWIDVAASDGKEAGEIIKGRLEKGVGRIFE